LGQSLLLFLVVFGLDLKTGGNRRRERRRGRGKKLLEDLPRRYHVTFEGGIELYIP